MMTKMPMTCTIQEASEFSGLSCYCIQKLVNSNEIAFVKSGRKTYINRESLKNYISGTLIDNANDAPLSEAIENTQPVELTVDEILERRKANGICLYCKAAMAEPGKTRCKACNEKHNAKRIELEESRLGKGLCKKCGKYPFVAGTAYCEVCTAKQKLSAEKNQIKGLQQRIHELEQENALLKSALQEVKNSLSTLNF